MITKKNKKQVEQCIEIYKDLKDHCTNCVQTEISTSDIRHKFKEMRALGYMFYKYPNGRDFTLIFCSKCGKKVNHRRLVFNKPSIKQNPRENSIPADHRRRLLIIYGCEDAFDTNKLAYGNTSFHIDHRESELRRQIERKPLQLLPLDCDDAELKEKYQLLRPEYNCLKREECKKCIETGLRPPSLDGIPYWYEGVEKYDEKIGCNGCFWAYPERWRESLTIFIKKNNEKR